MTTPTPPLTIKQIRAIAAVADRASLAQASESFAISQSSLSRQVAAAERALGHRLFQRGWTGMEPTAPGAIVIAHCRRVIADLANVRQSLETGGRRVADLGHHLTWPMLAAVAAVRATRGASAAAAYLETSQPDISRLLARVAAAIGGPPFVRGRAGLIPTEAVPLLCDLRDLLLSEVLALPDLLLAIVGETTDRVAIGLLPFSEQDGVVRVFGALLERQRHVRLQAVTGSYAALIDALRRGELDLVLGPLRDPAPFADLREIQLGDEWLTMVARRGHALDDTIVSMADFAETSWVVGPHGTPTRRYLDELLARAAVPPPTRVCEMVTFSLAEQMVLQSDSVGLLTYSTRKRAVLRDGLVVLSFDLPDNKRKIGLTIRRHHPLTVLQRQFVDLLATYLSSPVDRSGCER